jgi:hypothetical protein
MAEYNLDGQMSGEGNPINNLPLHPEYSNNIGRWKFLQRSYLGGAQFKLGKYLTRYVFESDSDYIQRLSNTPVDNHCKSIIHIYNSFLFRNEPKRDFGFLEGTPEINNFLEDADMEGRTWESFMRDVNIQSSIYGHCVVLIDRPETMAGTRAEELDQDIRPFATIFSPENVLDWEWERLSSGHYRLKFIRLLEQEERTVANTTKYYVRTWTNDSITLETVEGKIGGIRETISTKPNPLGTIPATWVYSQRTPVRGIGSGDIESIAEQQLSLFNMSAEAEQLIRLTNHPTLVKTSETEASAGAGAIITMPNELDPNLKPFILQPSGQNLEAILSTMRETIKSIDRMAMLGSIRAIETRQMSGIAMQTEYTTLDARLSEKAKNLEVAEEQIWRNFAKWQGQVWTGNIKYPTSFNVRDKNMDMDILKKVSETVKNLTGTDPEAQRLVKDKIKEIIAKDEDELFEMMHPVITAQNGSHHIQQMITDGYTDQQILQIHSEISQADITAVKQQLLDLDNAPTEPTPPEL